MIRRMVRASALDAKLYEEVERDRNAVGQAAMVVLIVSVAAGIGQLLSFHPLGAIAAVISGFLGWIVWSFITYWLGITFFKTTATRVTPGEVLRTIGFSMTPGVLAIFSFIPVLGWALFAIGYLWALVAAVIGVRAAFDFTDTGRAVLLTLLGWLILVLAQALLPIL